MKLIKEIFRLSYKEELYGPIGIKEIQNIYKDFLELKHVLAFSQSEVATISSLLESFLRRTIHWYKNSRKIGKLIVLERTDLFSIITKTLWDLHFFMLKDIPSISKSTKVQFHACMDCPEVREKVYRFLKT